MWRPLNNFGLLRSYHGLPNNHHGRRRRKNVVVATKETRFALSLYFTCRFSRENNTHTRGTFVSSRCARISPWLAGAHSTMTLLLLLLPKCPATTRFDGVATRTRCCCDVVAAPWLRRSRTHTGHPARTHVHGAVAGRLLRPARRATTAGRRGGEPRHPGALPNDHCLSADSLFSAAGLRFRFLGGSQPAPRLPACLPAPASTTLPPPRPPPRAYFHSLSLILGLSYDSSLPRPNTPPYPSTF